MVIKYNNEEFKSLLEARTAFLLDHINIKWEYEPDKYILKSGVSYVPDFKIHKNLYVESKGKLDKTQITFHKIVSKELKKDILLIGYEESVFINGTDLEEQSDEEDGFAVYFCKNCQTRSFVGIIYIWQCKNCFKGGKEGFEKYYFEKKHGIKELYNEYNLRWFKP